jgi:hypothetical protein
VCPQEALLPTILPPIPPQPVHTGFVLFGPTPAQLDWIVRSIYAALTVIAQNQEKLAMTMQDLGASQDRSEASTTAALAGITTEIQQVRDAVAALGTSPTPEELTAFKARIDANTDRVDAAVAMLSSDDPAAPAA